PDGAGGDVLVGPVLPVQPRCRVLGELGVLVGGFLGGDVGGCGLDEELWGDAWLAECEPVLLDGHLAADLLGVGVPELFEPVYGLGRRSRVGQECLLPFSPSPLLPFSYTEGVARVSGGCRDGLANSGIVAGGEGVAVLCALVDALVLKPLGDVQVPLAVDLVSDDLTTLRKSQEGSRHSRETLAR